MFNFNVHLKVTIRKMSVLVDLANSMVADDDAIEFSIFSSILTGSGPTLNLFVLDGEVQCLCLYVRL